MPKVDRQTIILRYRACNASAAIWVTDPKINSSKMENSKQKWYAAEWCKANESKTLAIFVIMEFPKIDDTLGTHTLSVGDALALTMLCAPYKKNCRLPKYYSAKGKESFNLFIFFFFLTFGLVWICLYWQILVHKLKAWELISQESTESDNRQMYSNVLENLSHWNSFGLFRLSYNFFSNSLMKYSKCL